MAGLQHNLSYGGILAESVSVAGCWQRLLRNSLAAVAVPAISRTEGTKQRARELGGGGGGGGGRRYHNGRRQRGIIQKDLVGLEVGARQREGALHGVPTRQQRRHRHHVCETGPPLRRCGSQAEAVRLQSRRALQLPYLIMDFGHRRWSAGQAARFPASCDSTYAIVEICKFSTTGGRSQMTTRSRTLSESALVQYCSA